MVKLDPALLSDLPPFRDIARSDLVAMLELATVRRVRAASPVFEEQTPADNFFLLLDGHVRVIRMTPDGEQVIVRHIASGQLIGIAAALGMERYPATAIAVDECLLLVWPMSLWSGFTSQYPGFARNSYAEVGARIQEGNERIVEMATQHVERRVAQALLRLVNQVGKKTEAGIEIGMPITRQDLSEMTGTTLHTVSRLLSAWGRDGVIASARRKITVTAPHKLMVIAEGR